MTESDPQVLAKNGKSAFEEGDYSAAAAAFKQAAELYKVGGDLLNAAEMKNNLSVALLQMDQAQEALDAVSGTEQVFAGAKDVRRQAMAVGNQASALEKLGKLDQALAAYERSANLFADADDGEMRSLVLKSAAGIKLKRGKISESAMSMLESMGATKKPSLLKRLLGFFIR